MMTFSLLRPAPRLSIFSLFSWFFAVLLVPVLASLPQGAKAADREQVAAFLEVTGFDVALDSIALSATSAPLMLGLEADAFGARWTILAESVFDPEVMRERATDILEATLDDELLAHGAAFYASELGQRLVEAENESHFEDDDIKEEIGGDLFAMLQANDDRRIDMFKRMNVAIDPNDVGAQAFTEIQVRFIMAAAYAGVVQLRTDEEGLRAAMAEDAEEVAAEMEKSALRNAAYTYRNFSAEEVLEYTEALEDPDMMIIYELMNAVHFEIMSNRFEVLATKMGQIQPEQEL